MSLKHFNKLIQSASQNVIIDVSEPDLNRTWGGKFSEKDIKEFISKNTANHLNSNIYSATIKTK